MFSSLKNKFTSFFRRKRHTNQLKSNRYDFHVVRHVHKRRFPSMRQFFSIGIILSRFEKIIFFGALIIFLMSLIWVGSVVSAKYRVEVPASGGSYTEGVLGTVQLINPLFSNLNDVDQDAVKLIYSGLMRYDAQRRLVPDLAVKYNISEDKKTYTFELKKDVVWHDGEPFTADDIVFTFNSIQDEQVESPLAVTFQGVKVEVIDKYTVVFTLTEPFSSFLSSLTVGILPGHIWSEIPIDQMRLAKRNLQPIGTGPFKFVRLVKDETGFIHRMELKRFTDFYRSPPFIKKFAFEFFNGYDGSQGLISSFREQKIDGISFVPFEYREKVRRKHVILHTLQLPQYTALFFNHDKGGLDDKNMRLALSYALDKERIVSDILENEGKVIKSPILENFPGFLADINTEEFSVEQANELLDKSWERISSEDYRIFLKDKRVAEAVEELTAKETTEVDTDVGTAEASEEIKIPAKTTTTTVDVELIKENVDQELDQILDEAQLFYRFPKGGNKEDILEYTLVTVATPEYTKVAELVAGYWQDVGVKVNVRFVDAKDMTREVLKTQDYDVLLYGIIIGNDPDQYPFWHSDQIEYPGLNLSHYVNRSVDKLLESIRETDDEAELNTLYTDLQKILLEDVPAAFLYTPTYTYALTEDVQGFDIDRISHPSDRFSNVTQWYMNTKNVWELK